MVSSLQAASILERQQLSVLRKKKMRIESLELGVLFFSPNT
jgi:hypothetical protein